MQSTPLGQQVIRFLICNRSICITLASVVAKNRRVNRDWEALLLRTPENARRCYEDLCNAP